MRFLIFCVLLLCGALWSCDRENYDDNTSTEESFIPIATELPFYTWATGIDTVPIRLDSSWIAGSLEEELRVFTGFSNINFGTPEPISVAYFMEFSAIPGWPIPEGNYDLQQLKQQRLQFNTSTNLWDTLICRVWSGDQIDGLVEIVETEQRLDTYWNLEFWEHTGFASGVLTDPDGTVHEFSSAFHRLR